VVSPGGMVLRRWGKAGSGPGEFRFTSENPSDPKATNGKIAVGANGLVYVSDSGNARVQVFTEQGRFVRQFGSFGSRQGQFLYPFDIAVDAGGNVYVADDQNVGVVNKFSPNGRLLWRIGGPGSAKPDLAEHHHFDGFDSHDRLVMVGDRNGAVIYLDGDGHEVDSFNASSNAFPNGACEVTVDALGNTYVTGCHSGPTLVFDRTHRLVAQWPGSGSPLLRSPSFGPNGEAFALRADPSGGVYADQVLKLRIRLPSG
jgi:tripartite motif-containing protein 71